MQDSVGARLGATTGLACNALGTSCRHTAHLPHHHHHHHNTSRYIDSHFEAHSIFFIFFKFFLDLLEEMCFSILARITL